MGQQRRDRKVPLKAKGARIEGLDCAAPVLKLWGINSGEVIRMPRIASPSGKVALPSFKPGIDVVTVYGQQSAINVKIIR